MAELPPSDKEIWGDGSELVKEVLNKALAEGYITKKDLPLFEGDDLGSLMGNLFPYIIEVDDDHNEVYDRWSITEGYVE